MGPVSVTLAPGTTAPVESTTTPPTFPFTVSSWASPATPKKRKRAHTNALAKILLHIGLLLLTSELLLLLRAFAPRRFTIWLITSCIPHANVLVFLVPC